MNKAKRKSTSLAVVIMILALCVIVGATFALWRYNVEGFSAVNFGKVEIAGNESIDRTIQLKDAVPGDVLFTDLSFSKSADSEPMYVRVHVEYTTPSTVPAIVDMVEDLNTNFAFDLNTATNTCQWSENYGNYFYLLDSTGNALYNIQDNTEIIISDEFRLPLMIEQPEDLSQYMEIVNLEIHLQAIQSLGIDSVIRQADARFAYVFGESGLPELPYTTGQYTEGDYAGKYYIEMGTYPQTLLTDANIKANLTLVTGETYTLEDTTGARAECPVYQYGEDKYVQFNMTSSNNANQYSSFTNLQGEQYYLIEPVRWIVIGDGNGNALPEGFDINATTLDSITVVSEKILVQQIFNPNSSHQTSAGTTAYADWENSQIRTFMNEVLLNDVFDEAEISYIQDTDLTTTYRTTSRVITSLDTTDDKLFSLAIMYQYGEYDDNYTANMLNDNNTVQYGSTYAKLKAKPTDLATATGVYTNTSTGFGHWWLRSGGYHDSNFACLVTTDGSVTDYYVYNTDQGARCAFVLGL